jgi:glycosyltransferase involved in cell wall biosynthesis
MKILNVQPFDYHGSIQRRSLKVAQQLQQFGIETIFLVPQTKKDQRRNFFSQAATEKGFKVYKTSIVRPLLIKNLDSLIRILDLFASLPESFAELYKILQNEKPDIIQINGFVCIQEAIATRLFHKKRRSWILISDLYPRLLILAFLPLVRSFERVFISKKMIPYYLGKQEDPIIYEPVDTTFFDFTMVTSEEKRCIKEKFGLQTSSPLLVSTSMVSPQKGLTYLILCIANVKSHFPNAKLIIIGDVIPSQTKYYQNLKNLIIELGLEANVVFTHYIPVSELRSLLSVADVFVMSSISEGTPVSILEAMSMGKAVIATNVGGVSEQVVNNKTGLLVNPKSSTELAQAIISLTQNPAKKKEMKTNARKRTLAMFSLQRCILQYKQYYLSGS